MSAQVVHLGTRGRDKFRYALYYARSSLHCPQHKEFQLKNLGKDLQSHNKISNFNQDRNTNIHRWVPGLHRLGLHHILGCT